MVRHLLSSVNVIWHYCSAARELSPQSQPYQCYLTNDPLSLLPFGFKFACSMFSPAVWLVQEKLPKASEAIPLHCLLQPNWKHVAETGCNKTPISLCSELKWKSQRRPNTAHNSLTTDRFIRHTERKIGYKEP